MVMTDDFFDDLLEWCFHDELADFNHRYEENGHDDQLAPEFRIVARLGSGWEE